MTNLSAADAIMLGTTTVDKVYAGGTLVWPPEAAPAGYAAAVLADSPEVFWQMQETSGTTMVDSSGNGHDGTYYNAPTLGATGLFADVTSVEFDGVTDRAEWADTVLTRSPVWTLEAWVSLGNTSGGEVMFIGTDFSGARVTMCLKTDGGVRYEGGFYRSGWHAAADTVNLVLDVPSHLVATCDSQVTKLYRNGSQVGTHDAGLVLGELDMTKMMLGADVFGGFRNCNLSHVAIWDTVLTAGQVAAHYAAV